tara:strand:- start:1863 stop:8399 length:6537 start_codon:yes stop_codon:yes gene_type:complete
MANGRQNYPNTQVQQIMNQNPGSVQRALDEQEAAKRQAEAQEQNQSMYAEWVRLYPTEASSARTLIKEGVHDPATISRILRLQHEKKIKGPGIRTKVELAKDSYTRSKQNLALDIRWFENIYSSDPESYDALKSVTEELDFIGEADPITGEGLLEEMIVATSNIVPSLLEGGKAALAGGTVAGGTALVAGQLGPQALTPEEIFTVPTAFAGGAAAASTYYWWMQGAGNLYRETAMRGVEPQIAKAVGAWGGIPYALVEQMQVNKLVPAGFKQGFKELVTNSLSDALKKVGKKGATTYATNITQEVIQEANLIAGEELAVMIDNAVNNKEIDQSSADNIKNRLLQTLDQSAKAFVPIVGGSTAISAAQTTAQIRSDQKQQQPEVEQRETEVKAIDEVNAAEEAGDTTPGTAALTRYLLDQDPDFDSRSSLEISDEVVNLTDDYIKNELKQDPEEFFQQEGITREEAEEYYATGSTQVNIQKNTTRTAIRLYKGHDADTVVEEFYHDFFEHLTDKNKAAFNAYHEETGDTRSVEEHFGQEGRDFFFSEKLHEKAGGVRKIFEQARETLKDLIQRIRKVRGSNIPQEIKDLYTLAGTRDFSQTIPLKPKEKKLLQARKMKLRLNEKPKSKEFNSWFSDSKVVDKNGEPMVMYHGTNETFEYFRTPVAMNKEGETVNDGTYFVSDPLVANTYANQFTQSNEFPKGAQVYPVYLSIKNPYKAKENEDTWGKVEDLKKQGYDGVVVELTNSAGPTGVKVYKAFSPFQIKGKFNERPGKTGKIMFQARLKRVGTTGQFVGFPKGVNTPSKLNTLRKFVEELAEQGKVGKDWYEKSAQAALDVAGGDMQVAEKILDLIAVTSPGMPVKTNMGQAVKLMYQIAQGEVTGAGRFPTTVRKQVEGLIAGKKLNEVMGDKKVVSFAENLKRSLTGADDNRVTVDVWMQRAYGFENEVPTDAQYQSVSKDVTRIAKKKGWTPKQTQAAIWVGAKARWETIGGNKMPMKKAMRLMKSTTADPKRLDIAKTDYADAMKIYEGRISYEYIPSTESKTLPGIHNASYEEKMEYHMEMNKALLDNRGKNIIAKELGVPEVRSLDGPGFWEGAVSPSRQMEVLVPSKASEKEINKKIGKEFFDTVEVFNSVIGLLYKQDAVATTKEFVAPSQKQANATTITVEEGLSENELTAINKELGNNFDIMPTSYGGIVINFADDAGKPFSGVDNNAFNTIVEKAVEKALQKSNKNVNLGRSLSTGRLTEGEKNGQNYKTRITKSRQRRAASRVYDQVYQQVQQVNERFSEKYNWGNPGKLESFDSQKITFQARKKATPPPTPVLELNPETFSGKWQRRLQDKMNRLGYVVKQAGKSIKISDEEDAYLASELYIGKARDRMDKFESEMYSEKGSLLDRIIKSGYSLEEFGEYLHARHAQERNNHIASIRDDMPDGGSGMTNDQAKEILKKFRGDKKIQSLAKEYYSKVTKRALRERLKSGLIKKETYETLTSYYKNYVPLFTVRDVENGSAVGKGFSVPQGSEIKRARGSEKARVNPIYSGIYEMMNLIRKSEKNKVGLKFLNMARKFDSSAWDIEVQKYRPIFGKDGEIQFMEPKFKLDDNVFAVREEGKLFLITINDEALARGLKNLGTEQANKYLVKANNFIRSIVTTFNPDFIITNFARDIQTALIHVGGEHEGVAKTVFKNTPLAVRGVFRNVRGKQKNYWSDRYEELKASGGKVGWFEMDSLAEHQEKVSKILENVQNGKTNVRVAAKAIGDLVNNVNEAVESGVRLATYDALVKQGMNKLRAAQVAKNITVNFNKKGEWGTTINSLYLFSNATIQGTARIGVSLYNSKKTRAMVGSIAGMSAGLSLVNYMIAPEEWEKKSEWEKDNYLIFMLPDGNDVRLRVPYGYNIFHVAGQAAGDIIQQGHVKGHGFKNVRYLDKAVRVLSSINDAVSPLGAGSVSQMISPTLLDPLVQLGENKKFTGSPIFPEKIFFQKKKARYKNYWDKNPPSWVSRSVTEGLSNITGGKTYKGIITDKDGNPQDHYIPGWVDLNPEALDHIGGFLTGGLGKFISRSVDTGINFAVGRPTPAKEIPFVRQFYGQPDKRGITEKRLIRKMIDKSEIEVYNHVEVARFKRYVHDAIKLNALSETDAKLVKDENGNEVPRVIRDFLNSQRLAKGEKKIDYRKASKKKKKRKVTF